MITAIVKLARSTLNKMHKGNTATAPNVMKTLVRAAEAALVNSEYIEYVKGTPIIGVCNIHMLGGKFLTAEPTMASKSDGYINLLNEDLDIVILKDTIIFLANVMRLSICFKITVVDTFFSVKGATALITWASENYVSSRKRGRKNVIFSSGDYTDAGRETLLSVEGVEAIMKAGIFNMTAEKMEKIYDAPNRCIVCFNPEPRIIDMSCDHPACCSTCMRKMSAFTRMYNLARN